MRAIDSPAAPAAMPLPTSASQNGDLPWYALKVRPRHEKATAQLLRHKGYEVFLPLFRSLRRWCDRLREVELPLFSTYLFCRLDIRRQLPVLATPGLVAIVGAGGMPWPVEEAEISRVRAVLAGGVRPQPWPFLETGSRVRITMGALCGLDGVLVDYRGSQRLVISVSLLQRSVAVEVDPAWVQPICGNACRVSSASADVGAVTVGSVHRRGSFLWPNANVDRGLRK